MDYFDASDEIQTAVQDYISTKGIQPHLLSVSPMLFQWLVKMRHEEAFLHGEKLDSVRPEFFLPNVGILPLLVDETLNDFQVIPE